MEKQFKSIVEELGIIAQPANKDLFIESRALQVIASARHLMKLLESTYSEDIAEDLTKRLLSAIKNDDTEKFCRKIRQVRKSK